MPPENPEGLVIDLFMNWMATWGGYIIVRGGDYRAETEDMSYIPRVTPLVSCPNSASFNPLGYEFPLVPH